MPIPYKFERINVEKDISTEKLEVRYSGADFKGNVTHNKDVEIDDPTKGMMLRSPNGHRWRLTIDNAGVLIKTDVDA